jgi:CBS domain-containing protein
MKVKELMTRQVSTIRADEPASTALRIMWECDCGSLPVVDDQGRALAIVTDRDIAMTSMFRDTPASELHVSDAMSREVHFCGPEDAVIAAEKTMAAHQIRRLPVIDRERKLVGVLSVADIVRGLSERGRSRDMIPEDIASTLADICAPRPQRGTSPSI